MRVAILVSLLLALVSGSAFAGRERSPVRACWANLRTLEAALELFEMEKGRKLIRPELARIDSRQFQLLVDGKYLHEMPMEPGKEKELHTLFVPGVGLFCLAHGAPGGKTSPKDRLVAAGVKDSSLLAAASDQVPVERLPWGPSGALWFLYVTAAFVAVEGLCLLRPRPRAPNSAIRRVAGIFAICGATCLVTVSSERPMPVEQIVSLALLAGSGLAVLRRLILLASRAAPRWLLPAIKLK